MRELTGRHVLGITVGAFSIIIGVNLVLAYQAVATFPGLEVQNSYIASQTFDVEKAEQQGLGWQVTPDYDAAAGMLHLAFRDSDGLAVMLKDINVLVGRPTDVSADMTPEFLRDAGIYSANATLAPGKWMLHVEATAPDGTRFRQRLNLFVRG